jgi:RP/EB family microtubule-associated protein
MKGIQTILYSTEDGFEVPPEEEVEKVEEFDDNETF